MFPMGPMNLFAMFRNSAKAAEARIIYDRVNAERFGDERAGCAAYQAATLRTKNAATSRPLSVDDARRGLRARGL